ncbi:MAG: SPOR domain-containing protein [Helicobacteraceae bacterium]|nr:SPOR domain-containing protein [Helicobacteraceae bacterium]
MRYAPLIALLCISLWAKAVIGEGAFYISPDPPPAQEANWRYAAQIGAFQNESAALALAAQAKKSCEDKLVVLRVLPRGYAPYLVWIVGFSSAAEAREYIAARKIKGFVVENR